MVTSGNTSTTNIIYAPVSQGGVGIHGLNSSPDLQAVVYGIPAERYYHDLSAAIEGKVLYATHTYTPSEVVYAEFFPGGIGIIGVTNSPDLLGFIQANTSRITSDQGDLGAWITALRSGMKDLSGFIRPSIGEESSVSGIIQSLSIKDLIGSIVPLFSGSSTLSGDIEAVPPKELLGVLLGLTTEELSGELEAVEPVNLSGTISGHPYLDLLGIVTGYELGEDLQATYSGFYKEDLHGHLLAINSGTHTLSGAIKGYLGIDQTTNLGGYIKEKKSDQTSISGHILAMQYKDLVGRLRGYTPDTEDLQATIDSSIENTLRGIVTATGSYLDLRSFIHPSYGNTKNLIAAIDGTCVTDLIGEIETDTTHYLYGAIQASGPMGLNLYATVTSNTIEDLLGQYEGIFGNTLSGSITSIPGVGLYGVIEPKVFYLDASIPINTYPHKNLKAIINAANCKISSNLSELRAFIHGTNGEDLCMNIVGVAGQYAIAEDRTNIRLRELVKIEDKVFLIYRPPALIENSIPVILTNSPLSDLVGIITGIYPSMDLKAEINAQYIPPVSREGVPLGEWVNTYTGETKIIKMFFNGNATNFYYSTSGNTTYAGNPEDYLNLIVEIYKKSDQEDSLLNQKQQVRQYKIDKLNEFKSIDDAIKFGIMYSASEIYSPLTAEITAVGATEDLHSSVSGIDSNYIKDLRAKYTAVTRDSTLSGTVDAAGGFNTLTGKIESIFTSKSNSLFVDVSGTVYMPSLFSNDPEGYSVILTTSIDLVTMNSISSRPDLWSSIQGIATDSLDASISGV